MFKLVQSQVTCHLRFAATSASPAGQVQAHSLHFGQVLMSWSQAQHQLQLNSCPLQASGSGCALRPSCGNHAQGSPTDFPKTRPEYIKWGEEMEDEINRRGSRYTHAFGSAIAQQARPCFRMQCSRAQYSMVHMQLSCSQDKAHGLSLHQQHAEPTCLLAMVLNTVWLLPGHLLPMLWYVSCVHRHGMQCICCSQGNRWPWFSTGHSIPSNSLHIRLPGSMWSWEALPDTAMQHHPKHFCPRFIASRSTALTGWLQVQGSAFGAPHCASEQ